MDITLLRVRGLHIDPPRPIRGSPGRTVRYLHIVTGEGKVTIALHSEADTPPGIRHHNSFEAAYAAARGGYPVPEDAPEPEPGRRVPRPVPDHEITHRYMPGDMVWVLNTTAMGNYFVEGQAEVMNACTGRPDHYRVRFPGNAPGVIRFVDIAAQGSLEQAEARAAGLNKKADALGAA